MLRLWRVGAADAQFLSCDTRFLQVAKDLFGHAFGQVHEAVILANIHTAYEAAFDSRFVRNRAHDIAGLHAMNMADLQAKYFAIDVVPPEEGSSLRPFP